MYTFARVVINNGVLRCVWIRTSNKNVKVFFNTWKFTTCFIDVSTYLRRPSLATWVVPHDVSTVLILFSGVTWSVVQRVISKVIQCINVLPRYTALRCIWRAVMLWIASVPISCPRHRTSVVMGWCILRLRGSVTYDVWRAWGRCRSRCLLWRCRSLSYIMS